MKRIMGKKVTPPTSPVGSSLREEGEDDGSAVGSIKSASPGGVVMRGSGRASGNGAGGAGGRAFSPGSDLLTVPGEGEGGGEGGGRMSQRKGFLEAAGEVGDGEGGGEEEGDGSPNPTASLSTGNGASTHASPSSLECKE